MRRISLLVTLVFLGGLMISGQALAAGQSQHGGPKVATGLSVDQPERWHQVQNRMLTEDQTQQLTVLQVAEMQGLLTANGYDVGSVGFLDEGTMTALRHFQKDQGLALTGMPDERTLRALALNSGQLEFFGLSPAYGEKDYDYNEYNCCP